MKTLFASDQGLLTEEEMQYIENKVVETFRYVLVARKLFPIQVIGRDGGEQLYRYYTETDPSEAVIDMTGKGQSDDHPLKSHHDVNIPVIHKEFFINWRDLASSRTKGPGLLDDCIRTATRKVAEAEDRLLLSGECTTWAALGILGLFTATGHHSAAQTGNWPANALADINIGRANLQAHGFVGIEPVLIGQPALVKCLDGAIANTGLTWRQFLLNNNIVSAIIESSNAYAADCGEDSVILVIPGEGNFYAVQSMPLNVNIWYDKSNNVYGTVRETITPIVTRPASVYEITDIVCGA